MLFVTTFLLVSIYYGIGVFLKYRGNKRALRQLTEIRRMEALLVDINPVQNFKEHSLLSRKLNELKRKRAKESKEPSKSEKLVRLIPMIVAISLVIVSYIFQVVEAPCKTDNILFPLPHSFGIIMFSGISWRFLERAIYIHSN